MTQELCEQREIQVFVLADVLQQGSRPFSDPLLNVYYSSQVSKVSGRNWMTFFRSSTEIHVSVETGL